VTILRNLSPLLDLILPRTCVSCGEFLAAQEPGLACGLCWSRVVPLAAPLCARCGHPLTDEKCKWCDLLPPFIRAARSYCWFPSSPADRIVAALKYDGWSAVALEIGDRMSRMPWPSDVVEESPVLVPVPLSGTRLRERGYNQSELLARALGGRWQFPVVVNCLRRVRRTVSQTQLNPDERARNVAGAFVAGPAVSTLHGAHVILVDDVVTTAATLNECAAVLFAAGVRIVSYATFGRARATGDVV
jgi:ComF family protein